MPNPLVFLAGSLALLPAAAAFDATEPSFDRWRARYGVPSYAPRAARARALRAWRDNLRRVEQHNADSSKTYRMVSTIAMPCHLVVVVVVVLLLLL